MEKNRNQEKKGERKKIVQKCPPPNDLDTLVGGARDSEEEVFAEAGWNGALIRCNHSDLASGNGSKCHESSTDQIIEALHRPFPSN